MTDAAERILARGLKPDTWMFQPPPDHAVWLTWERIFGLKPPVKFERIPDYFKIGRGWREEVIYYDDYYTTADRLRREMDILRRDFSAERKRLNVEVSQAQGVSLAATEQLAQAKTAALQERSLLSQEVVSLRSKLSLAQQQLLDQQARATQGTQLQLEFIGIFERGGPRERVEFKATANVDITSYILLDSEYITPASIAAGQRPSYWFPSKVIAAGSHVVLLSGQGKPTDELRDGVIYHFLYRGSASPLYKTAQSCSVLLKFVSGSTTNATHERASSTNNLPSALLVPSPPPPSSPPTDNTFPRPLQYWSTQPDWPHCVLNKRISWLGKVGTVTHIYGPTRISILDSTTLTSYDVNPEFVG